MTKKNIPIKKPVLIVLIVIVLLFFISVFYWIQIRPATIRSKCAIEAEELKQKESSLGTDYYKLLTGNKEKNSNELSDIYDENYKFCLHKHGL